VTDFRINVIVNPSAAVKGTSVVKKQLSSIERRALRLRTTLRQMLGPLAGGLAIVGAIRSMARFEESLATAKAVSGATERQFAALRDRALELGVTTRFSATQAADALVLLSRAGFTVDESLTSVGATLRLAQAGGLGLAEAADITASALRGFNLNVEQTTDVTDVLTVTTNNANSNISEMGQALKFVAPIAQGLQQDIRATSAAIGILSNAGLKATLAGTGLRRVFAELESPGTKFKVLLNEIGLTTDQVAPSQNKLIDILERLKEGGIDAGEALEIFGQRGGPAFQVLVSNTDKLAQLNGKLRDTTNATKDVAEIIDNTLNGALFRAKSAIEGFVLGLGQAGISDALVVSLDAVAATFRFAANNADLLTTGLVALSAAGVGKLAASILTKLLPSMRAAALATVLFRGNILAMSAAFSAATLAMSVNPFVAIAVIAGTTYLAIKKLTEGYIGLGDTLAQVEEDSKRVPAVFAALSASQRELNNLNRSIAAGAERGAEASEAQKAKLKELQERIESLKVVIKGQATATQESNARDARKAEITEALIERLTRRRDITAALTEEQKKQVQYEQELDKLEDQQATATSAEKATIESLLAETESLSRQKKVYEGIMAPLQAYKQGKQDLQALLAKGAITADMFRTALTELNDSLGQSAVGPAEEEIRRLEDAVALKEILAEEGKVIADATRIENDLRNQGVIITGAQREKIFALLTAQEKLTEEAKKQRDLSKEGSRDGEAEARALDRLERQVEATKLLAEERARLKVLFDDGRISLEAYNEALDRLNLQANQASATLEAGFSRAFAKLKMEAQDLAAVAEQITNTFANTATDALVKFAETGKFAFKDFARSIISDLIRITARMLILKAIEAGINAFGSGAPAATATSQPSTISPGALQSLSGTRAEGGPVQANRSYLVGEEGPEILNTNRSGTIIPNGGGTGAPAPVNVQVVNVDDPRMIPEAINDGTADDAIINMLTRKKSAVQRLLK